MAISLSKLKQLGAKRSIAAKIAKQYEEEQRKADRRGAFSGILGGVGGKFLGKGIAGFLGLSGAFAPLGMALGNLLAKKGAHELTRDMASDPSKISEGDEYGYSKEEASTLRESLKEQEKATDPYSQKGWLGQELFGQYLGALAGGTLGEKGHKFSGEDGLKERFKFAGKEMGSVFEDFAPGFLKGKADPEQVLTSEEISQSQIIPGGGGTMVTPETSDNLLQSIVDEYGVSEEIPYSIGGGMQRKNIRETFQQGGQVPPKAPTIVDYFSMHGKTLGGSNKQSLLEMAGRK